MKNNIEADFKSNIFKGIKEISVYFNGENICK